MLCLDELIPFIVIKCSVLSVITFFVLKSGLSGHQFCLVLAWYIACILLLLTYYCLYIWSRQHIVGLSFYSVWSFLPSSGDLEHLHLMMWLLNLSYWYLCSICPISFFSFSPNLFWIIELFYDFILSSLLFYYCNPFLKN